MAPKTSIGDGKKAKLIKKLNLTAHKSCQIPKNSKSDSKRLNVLELCHSGVIGLRPLADPDELNQRAIAALKRPIGLTLLERLEDELDIKTTSQSAKFQPNHQQS